MTSKELKLNSLFRVQTILLLQKETGKTGYDLAKEIEQITGKKPSSGKIYPFLHELKDGGYINEIDHIVSGREKTTYVLTDKGDILVTDLLTRMSNLLDARLFQLLDTCYHCGVKLYESKVSEKINGQELTFCCSHCKDAYLNRDKVSEHSH